ncbi:MAG: GNAT family N-acetyltransferase [Firmicutes bacterium]|nr:GNAT family N-acetyltransferase [Bacillota bacterium]
MIDFKIQETDEYERLVDFFIENGLEYTDEDAEEVPTDLVKCWKIEDEGKLIGAFVLAKREGEYICDGVAVDAAYRKHHLGKALLDKGIEEAKAAGGSRMYLNARAPEFYRKQGFITVSEEEAPNFFECFTCPQYGVSCHPEVMRKDFE